MRWRRGWAGALLICIFSVQPWTRLPLNLTYADTSARLLLFYHGLYLQWRIQIPLLRFSLPRDLAIRANWDTRYWILTAGTWPTGSEKLEVVQDGFYKWYVVAIWQHVCLSVTCWYNASKLRIVRSCRYHRQATQGSLVFIKTKFHPLGYRDW